MRFYWLLLGILGVWRVTHLLHAEDGPWDLVARLRRALGKTILGQAFDCFYCLSLWIALPFALAIAESWKEFILLWLALSGAAAVLQRATARAEPGPAAVYLEDEEGSHVLRPEGERHFGDDRTLPRR